MFFSFFFFYSNKFVKIFQAITGHLGLAFLEFVVLLLQALSLNQELLGFISSLLFLFLKPLFLSFKGLLLELGKNVLRLLVGQVITGYLFPIIFRTTTG
jgi:hypothetical protein